MKQNHKLLAVFLFLSFILAGCSTQKSTDTESMQNSSVSSTEATAEQSGEGEFSSAGDGQFVTTSSGIYELQTIFADSVNLFYTDAESAKRIFLCTAPNCNHTNESCTSYIATPGATFPPLLLSVGEQLGVFMTESTDTSGPYLLLMNYDGSEKTKVFELSANQYLQGSFFENNAYLYFDISSVNTDGSVEYSLLRMNKKSKKVETVTSLGSGADYYLLCGCIGEDLLFQHISDSSQVSYYRTAPAEIKFKTPFYVDEDGRGNVLFTDGYLFTLNDTGDVTRKNLTSGESFAMTCPIKDGYTAAGIQYLFDGDVLVTTSGPLIDGNYDVGAYFLDFNENSCTEMTLHTPYNGRPVYALATVGDQVYVSTDYREYTPEIASVNGTDSELSYVANTYAFISKNDYRDSNANGYRMVEDAFE